MTIISVEGFIDTHVHTGPAPFRRIGDTIDVARWCHESKMTAIVIKSHFEATVTKVYHARKEIPDLGVYAGIALNRGVGGINPLAVEGQLDGQVFSGMGQVLYEECRMEDGMLLNPSRLEYKLPRTYELPDVEYILVETIDPYGPFGAKEVGEGPIVVSMSAIASAVANAVGAFVPEIPMTPWKVLRMLRAKDKGAEQFDKHFLHDSQGSG